MSFTNVLRSSVRRAAMPAVRRTATRTTGRRGYASVPEPTGRKTSYTLPLGVGAVLAAAGAYYVFTSDAPREADTLKKEAVQIAKAATHTAPTKESYQEVYNAIVKVMESDEAAEYDDGSFGPVLLRLAWHCSGTYDVNSNTGGSNYATMRFEPESLHGANAGLNIARALMEKVKAQFPWISYGDLWTLAGVAAVQEMGGPVIPWRPGRIDGFAKDATPDGRLPDASLGSDHLRQIFGRMGFNDQEIVALSGAHALGRCHTDRSGFEGPWTFSPTTLTNDYYKLLFDETWVWKKWGGPAQYADKKTGTLMMLPTDYILTKDKSFKKHAKAYAADQDLFFKDFAAVVSRLFELGVPTAQFVASDAWHMKTMDEQKK